MIVEPTPEEVWEGWIGLCSFMEVDPYEEIERMKKGEIL